MNSSLLPFFQWCESTPVGHAIKESLWLFPVIESVHLIGLAMLGGALLVVDLRMLGLGLRDQTIGTVARDARPWLLASLGVMLLTGLALFLSESVKCYYSPAFWVKITTIPIAIIFTLTVRQRVAVAGIGQATLATRLTALTSLALWFSVAAAGRWIGFS